MKRAWYWFVDIWEGLKKGLEPVIVFVATAAVIWAVGYVVIQCVSLIVNANEALERGC